MRFVKWLDRRGDPKCLPVESNLNARSERNHERNYPWNQIKFWKAKQHIVESVNRQSAVASFKLSYAITY